MKRLSSALLVLSLVALPAIAADEGINVERVQLVKAGSAPTLEEILRNHPADTPTSFGEVREVVNRTPEWLLNRQPSASPADPLLDLGLIESLAPAASLSIEGFANTDNGALFGFLISPPDTNGDVGVNFYVQYVNLGWEVFDKTTGASVGGGPFAGNVFWQGFGGVCESDNAGDPIVLYDHLAGEWVFSQFTSSANPDGHQCFAISQGGSPFGPYLLYDFVVSPGAFNDYPKISLWPDAYYMTTNEFTASFAGVNITAFDRAGLLTGTGSAVQVSIPFTGLAPVRFSLQPAHLEGGSPAPAAGTCNLIIQSFDDDTWGNGGGPDGYQFWEFCPDFVTVPNSTFTTGPFLTAPAFNFGLTSVPQPGTTQLLDPLGQFTMYRFGTRAEGGNLVGALAHTVDVGAGRNGIRWATFNLPSLAGVGISDTGTFAPGGEHRWTPSATLDSVGNLGIVYSRASGTSFPSVYFSGRETSDPAGTLQTESVCIDGTGSQLGSPRWGDYASASVDPVDSCTFWVTSEYVETTGTVAWTSRICSFKFPSCGATGGGPLQAARQTTDERIRTVALSGFANPVVTMGPPSFIGNQPTTVRVRNVTAGSFQHNLQEWDYLDGSHVDETIGYLALDAGAQNLGSLAAEAGTVNLNQNWTTVNFSQTFTSAPVVFAQTASFAGGQAVTERIRNVTSTSFQVRLQEEEANDDIHNTEIVHWIAVETGSTTVSGRPLAVGVTANSVTHNFATINFGSSVINPILIADMQTFDGPDTAALRYRNLSATTVEIKVEEEKSANAEINHTTEVVGWLVIGP